MPHGTPDWAEMAPRSTVYSGIDLTELAARLSSIVTFDRRGDVILVDGFESGIAGWAQNIDGVGGSITASAARYRNGSFSCKMVTGAILGNAVELLRYLPFSVLSKIGYEASFTVHGNNEVYLARLIALDGTLSTQGELAYDSELDELQYRDEDDNLVAFATGLDLRHTDSPFHTWKLVVDLVTAKYVRAMLNDVTYNLSAYNLRQVATVGAPILQVKARLETKHAFSHTSYVDDVIITQNEQ